MSEETYGLLLTEHGWTVPDWNGDRITDQEPGRTGRKGPRRQTNAAGIGAAVMSAQVVVPKVLGPGVCPAV